MIMSTNSSRDYLNSELTHVQLMTVAWCSNVYYSYSRYCYFLTTKCLAYHIDLLYIYLACLEYIFMHGQTVNKVWCRVLGRAKEVEKKNTRPWMLKAASLTYFPRWSQAPRTVVKLPTEIRDQQLGLWTQRHGRYLAPSAVLCVAHYCCPKKT